MSIPASQTSVAAAVAALVDTTPAVAKKQPPVSRLSRSSSIDTIRRINSVICWPHTYLLPTILNTWVKTGRDGFQSAAEGTILFFRALVFSALLKLIRIEFRALPHLVYDQLRRALIVRLVFLFATVLVTVQMGWCLFYLCRNAFPVGLGFLLISLGYIVGFGHWLNKAYLIKRDVKRKVH